MFTNFRLALIRLRFPSRHLSCFALSCLRKVPKSFPQSVTLSKKKAKLSPKQSHSWAGVRTTASRYNSWPKLTFNLFTAHCNFVCSASEIWSFANSTSNTWYIPFYVIVLHLIFQFPEQEVSTYKLATR